MTDTIRFIETNFNALHRLHAAFVDESELNGWKTIKFTDFAHAIARLCMPASRYIAPPVPKVCDRATFDWLDIEAEHACDENPENHEVEQEN
jgi:hypothetical protein